MVPRQELDGKRSLVHSVAAPGATVQTLTWYQIKARFPQFCNLLRDGVDIADNANFPYLDLNTLTPNDWNVAAIMRRRADKFVLLLCEDANAKQAGEDASFGFRIPVEEFMKTKLSTDVTDGVDHFCSSVGIDARTVRVGVQVHLLPRPTPVPA